MSEFDQLFKEKVEEKKYEYSAKSWQSFKQKAGWKKSSKGLHTVVISCIGIIAVVLGCYFGYRFLNDTNEKPVTPGGENSCQKPAAAGVAESQTTEMKSDEQMPETSTASQVEKSATGNTDQPKPQVEPVEEPTTVAKPDTTATKPTPSRKPTNTGRVRHIFVINPDTIPNNDF
ncbi:MAG: hypothetical protein MJZ70_00115 [Bacteroidales bacterium]|nr:hypothetical protein [Bacteroidales bacterium]